MKRLVILIGVLATLCTVAQSAGASVSRWSVIPERSSITLSVRAFGGTQTGRFSRWNSDIRFDPDQPRSAQVAIDVHAASLTMDQPGVTRRAIGPGFLDVARYPSIAFRLRSLEPVSSGRYTARAEVTVKGRSHPVAFPVTLDLDEGVARMNGGFVLDRAAYGIGGGTVLNGLIERDVRVDVALATRQTAP